MIQFLINRYTELLCELEQQAYVKQDIRPELLAGYRLAITQVLGDLLKIKNAN